VKYTHIDSHKVLVGAIRTMLKPIARFCLRNALRVQDLLECIKVALIEAAEDEMVSAGEEVNISRLSAMTGLHRRDVIRIFRKEDTKEAPQGTINKIVGQWLHDRRFISRSGDPRVLSIQGQDAEFKRLVNIVSNDLNPATVLFELERVGVVERTRNGIKLVKKGYLLKGDLSQGIRLLSRDTSDLMTAVLQNVTQEEIIPNLHANTNYDKVRADAVPEIREWLHREGSALHQKARNYLSQFDLDIHPVDDKEATCVRVALGTFSLVETGLAEKKS
jgi:ribosomal protein S19E (S16A)